MNRGTIVLHYPIKRSVLAYHLCLSPATFQKRLDEIGVKSKRTLTPIDLEKIKKEIGVPSWVELIF